MIQSFSSFIIHLNELFFYGGMTQKSFNLRKIQGMEKVMVFGILAGYRRLLKVLSWQKDFNLRVNHQQVIIYLLIDCPIQFYDVFVILSYYQMNRINQVASLRCYGE